VVLDHYKISRRPAQKIWRKERQKGCKFASVSCKGLDSVIYGNKNLGFAPLAKNNVANVRKNLTNITMCNSQVSCATFEIWPHPSLIFLL
jgi:hypothetical protein